MHTPPSQGLPTLSAVHSSDGGSTHTAHARELATPASSVPSHVPFVHEPPPSQAWPAAAIEHSTGSQNPQGWSMTAVVATYRSAARSHRISGSRELLVSAHIREGLQLKKSVRRRFLPPPLRAPASTVERTRPRTSPTG